MSEQTSSTAVSSTTTNQNQDAHLFVLIHGLWGGPNHMRTIETSIVELLQEKSSEKIVTLKPSSFRFWKTYDGLKLNSEKVITEIFYEIEALKGNNLNVTKISIVGYSLGGLIARYLIGLLYEMGFFDLVHPVFFSTFATPHVGIEFFNNNIFDAAANKLGGYLFGKSGRELFLSDTQKALREMADPEKSFYQGLTKFEKHILLANIKNDRTVAFFTSYITEYSPFDEWDLVEIKYLKDLPLAKVGKIQVRPKFVDLTRTNYLSEEALKSFRGNIQEDTSVLRSNKIVKVLIVVAIGTFFLPIWIPSVLSTSIVVSIYSGFKIRLVTHPKIKSHWQRVRDSIFNGSPVDPQDAKMGEYQREQRRHLERHESFKGDTSKITENAMNNLMYVEDRLQGRSPPEHEEEDNIIEDVDQQDHHDDDVNGDGERELMLGKTENFNIDVVANDKVTKLYHDHLRIKDYEKFPIFQEKNKLNIGEEKQFIIDNLNKLDWVKIPVYMDVWNAHDAIVSRRGPGSNAKGTSIIGLWCSILRNHIDEDLKEAATS